MNKVVFADSVGQIHFAGGMIRFDLCNLIPGTENEESKNEITTRLIMTPQAFISMNDSMKQLIDKMIESGILIKNTATVDQEISEPNPERIG